MNCDFQVSQSDLLVGESLIYTYLRYYSHFYLYSNLDQSKKNFPSCRYTEHTVCDQTSVGWRPELGLEEVEVVGEVEVLELAAG